ncbi:TRAP transporter small permease [uncultured Thalassospira sp.]|jgi:TRAP-type C4-dicarboxylate transport system permease small subunit|uniref:TRAP transporter small permease subunit n=1 Tax=uncultured Thalassospira sp. TaxID=404382 RepID=UPI0030DDDB95|tara:strand:- start:965 stop:1471 length:507 start_codon:yes stop_codon:yes gene_type:complete
MKFLVKFIDSLSKLGAAIAALSLVGMVSFILLEIVLRTVFDSSTFIMDEMVGYGVAAATFLALPYALAQGSIIRVELFLGHVTGKNRKLLEVFSCLVGLGVTWLLISFIWVRVARAWTRHSVSSSIAEVPMWIPQGIILVGLCLLFLQFIALLIRQFIDDQNHETPAL